MSVEAFRIRTSSQPVQRTLAILGTQTSYWIYGPDDAATTFLLIHGFRGDHHGLELIAQDLADKDNYRILVPDLPGFGQTTTDPATELNLEFYCAWLGALPQALGLDNYHLVGHSFGSIITAHAVAKGTLTPRSLTLINPICEPALEGKNRLAASGAHLYYRLGATLPEKLGMALLKSSLITRITSEFMMKTKHKLLRRYINRQHHLYFSAFNNRNHILQAYTTSISADVSQVAHQLALPTLLLIGEKDDLGSVPAQKNLAQSIARHRWVLIKGVGHLIHYEAPKAAAESIHIFTKDHP